MTFGRVVRRRTTCTAGCYAGSRRAVFIEGRETLQPVRR